ncbi:serine/threonine protein kinase [Naegleria gruberi]|uniref:Serine/threonine protein kinase n=1 Tax=Naegleria gruberi TaxID=5762 RepID=D2V6W5_NAEGR|nr:serine/threonine protein kinase [Naegleria gruberi]EFC47642.1 serine/threonine protein kinase [Naegleria gruberi]|eukprot:XP_002680386.1 serine/threonine protein kinase [Naegleria gruberi strain NEG-M]
MEISFTNIAFVNWDVNAVIAVENDYVSSIYTTRVIFEEVEMNKLNRMFDVFSATWQPDIVIRNSKLVDSYVECSGGTCFYENLQVVRNLGPSESYIDFELDNNCEALFRNVSFTLNVASSYVTIGLDESKDLGASTQKCTSTSPKHYFIFGHTARQFTIEKSNFATNCTGSQCYSVGAMTCATCSKVKISDTNFNATGSLQVKSSESLTGTSAFITNVQFSYTTCHFVSIQNYYIVLVANSAFMENSNMGTLPVLAIADSQATSVVGTKFLDNDGGALFLQNVRNGSIIGCVFEGTSSASAVRYLDLQQFSEIASDSLKVIDSQFINNSAQFGAAINSNTLKLSVLRCNFKGNTALRHGGSIYISDQSERVTDRVFTLVRSTFSDGYNTALSSFGGFIYVTSESGSVSITTSKFETATSQDSGGCLYLDIPYSSITYSTFSKCYSKYDGGAIFIEKGKFFLNDSTLFNSTCDGYGGALYLKSSTYSFVERSSFNYGLARQGRAGGIYGERRSSLILKDSSFEGNVASIRGSAIYVSRGDLLDVRSSKFSQNVIIYKPEEAYSEQAPGGGAVFAYGLTNLNIQDSLFQYNRIVHNPVKEGMGGAILFTPSSVSTTVSNITLSYNKADNGGAMYLYNIDYPNSKFQFSNINFLHNRAENSGGAVFLVGTTSMRIASQFKTAFFDDNYAELYGDNYASDPKYFALSSNGWEPKDTPYDFPLSIFKSLLLKKYTGFNLYAGQFVKITLDSFDLFNERMESIKNADIDLVFTTNINNTEDYKNHVSTTFSNDTAIFSNVQVKGQLNQTLILYFKCKNVIQQFYFPVNLEPNCPFSFDYSVDDQACIFNSAVQNALLISLGVIVALGLTFIILLTTLCLYFFKKKLKELKKREQAEEDLHKRLLQYQLISSKHSLHDDTAGNSSFNQDKSWIIKPEDLQIVERIGQGGESVIFLAKWMNNTVAVKRINIDITQYDEDNQAETDTINSTFEKEAYILSTLRFPNIVTFYGIAITPSDRFIVIEYLSGGTLRKKIHDSKKKKTPLNLATKLNYLLDVAYGMKYLHSLDPPLIHRDLKPENILISENNVAKICDFGLGREFTQDSASVLTSAIGTPVYMPPELILGQDYSEKCDSYSFGIIMWELLFEERAYSPESFEAMKNFMVKHKNLINVKPYEPINLDEDSNIDDVELEKEPLRNDSPLVKSNIDIEQIDSITLPNFNMISITTEIVNGLRPIIPFRIKKNFSFQGTGSDHISSSSRRYQQLDPLLKEYVNSFLMENEKGGIFGSSRNSEMKLALVVKELCEIMTKCWDKDVERPSFAEICDKLNKCSSILMN